jgi:hypothetical protein
VVQLAALPSLHDPANGLGVVPHRSAAALVGRPLQIWVDNVRALSRAGFTAVPNLIYEAFEGKTVWEGIVYVFDLDGHPTATRCYAWSEKTARFGRFRQRFFVVLHQEPADSPAAAVRATIVADYESHGGERG